MSGHGAASCPTRRRTLAGLTVADDVGGLRPEMCLSSPLRVVEDSFRGRATHSLVNALGRTNEIDLCATTQVQRFDPDFGRERVTREALSGR